MFSKKFEFAVSKARLKSNLDDNTIQSEKKSWKKVENGGIWTQGSHPSSTQIVQIYYCETEKKWFI